MAPTPGPLPPRASGRQAGGRTGCSDSWNRTAASMLSWTWSRLHQLEEAVAFQHLEDLRLDPRQVEVDLLVDACLGDRHQHVGTFGVDEVDTFHAQDHAVDPGGRLDPHLAQAVRERVGIDEEQAAVEAQDLHAGDGLAVVVRRDVVERIRAGLASQLRDVGQRRHRDEPDDRDADADEHALEDPERHHAEQRGDVQPRTRSA